MNIKKFLRNVLLKTLVLFVLANLLAGAVNLEGLGQVSLYNRVFPGRDRFPFGENPQIAYNLSLYNLDAMFASQKFVMPPAKDEFRVFILGDSSVWGTLLQTSETLAGQLDQMGLNVCGNKTVRVYNLGYPTLSLVKDLLVLQRAMVYQPDLIIWVTTLESFPLDRQFDSPLVANNGAEVRGLIQREELPLNVNDPKLLEKDVWGRTLIGQRRELADLLRLQLYGVMWAATGIDQEYPSSYPPPQRDFKPDDVQFLNHAPDQLPADKMGYALLKAGFKSAGKTPVWLVNEPILVSSGENKMLRYNFYYPRWAYDQYRTQLGELAQDQKWTYFDEWNLAPEAEFTNSAIHLNPDGEKRLVEVLQSAMQAKICR